MTNIADGVEILKKAIESGKIKPAAPQAMPTAFPNPTFPPEANPLLRSPMPSTSVLVPDTVRQFNTGAIPQTRILPISLISNPIVGSQAQSQAIVQIAATPSGGVTSVALVMPKEFVAPVSGSPVTSAGTLTTFWATEAANTVFAATPPSPVVQTITGSGLNGSAITLGGTSAVNPQVAFIVAATVATSTPSGFTSASNHSYYQLLSTSTAISPNLGTAGNTAGWAGVLTFFASNGSAPVFNFGGGRTGANTNFVIGPFTPTAGTTIVVTLQLTSNAGFFTVPAIYSVTDNNGNPYVQIASVNNGLVGTNGSQIMLFTASNVVGGSTSLTFTQVSGPAANFINAQTDIMWVTNLVQAGPGVPSFQLLQPVQIPFLDASKIGSGQLPVARGGTGADLSTTGGLHQFLAESAAHVISSVQPDFSDLAGASTKFATSYNGIALVSNGIPTEYATVDLTAQTAAKATTTLYAVPATGAGQYRVSWNAKVTTVAGTSSTLGPLTIVYTDPDNVVQTITAAAQSNAGIIETSDAGNTITTVLLGLEMLLNCKAITNITYAFAYASNAAAAMNYNLHIKLEAL